MAIALVALGSNVGDAMGHIQTAVRLLERHVSVLSISPVYETEPMYVVDQPNFLNAALAAQTSCGPMRLLSILKQIEREVGRLQSERYGPREVDLDLIAYGSLIFEHWADDRLVLEVPHPRAPERRFVLQPLADVAPDGFLPGLGKITDLLEATKHQATSVQRRDDVALSLHSVR